MSSDDVFPHFDFNLPRISEYWKGTLGNVAAAKMYLRVVGKRLEHWLAALGPWVDFDFAVKRLREDLGIEDAESRLVWLALKHRVQLANTQRRQFADVRHEDYDLHVDVPVSSDGTHDKVWHETFGRIYKRALAKERKELEKLRETGLMPASDAGAPRKKMQRQDVRVLLRPRLQWAWANRLLAYLFEMLREEKAICDDGEMWAALDGVFRDKNGKPITRKDLALWAHQYRNNKSCEEDAGKPKKHEMIDQIVEKIRGKGLIDP
jgi:hypothetical protein